MMKRIFALIVLITFLAAGTAAAAPGNVGVIDTAKIMAESPKVKAWQEQLDRKAVELSRQLEAEKPNLSKEQFEKKQEAAYGVFLQLKKDLEVQIDASIKQALEQVAKEKNLVVIIYKNSVAYGGLDVTPDVLAKMK